MGKNRRQYTREFKVEAVKQVVEQGRSVKETAEGLGIAPNLLTRWKQLFLADGTVAFPGQGKLKPHDEEIRRLRRELAQVRQERDILRKPRPTSRTTRAEVPVHPGPPGDSRSRPHVRSFGGLPQ